MLCARAILTAGPGHQHYQAGTAVRAVLFMRAVEHPQQLRREAFRPIAARGWQRITIDGHKLLSDDHDFSGNAPAAEAFRVALDQGIGMIVLGKGP